MNNIQLARDLVYQHLGQAWSVTTNNSMTTLGICRHNSKSIGLSTHLLDNNGWEVVKQTVVHEIAHALVGYHAHHNSIWRAKCIALGGDGKTCSEASDARMPYPWLAECFFCSKATPLLSKPRTRVLVCRQCRKPVSFRKGLFYDKE